MKEALEIRRRLLGAFHPDVFECRMELSSMDYVRANPRQWMEETKVIMQDAQEKLGEDHDITLRAKEALAWVYFLTEEANGGVELLQAAHDGWVAKYGSNNVRVLNNDHSRAWYAMFQERDNAKANALYEDMLDRGEKTVGEELLTAEAMGRVGFVRMNKGLNSEGRSLVKKSHEIFLTKVGTNHPGAFSSQMGIGWSENPYWTPGEWVRNCVEVVEGYKRLGNSPGNFLEIRGNLQYAYWRAGEADKAIETARVSLKLQHQYHTSEHRWYFVPVWQLTSRLSRLGRNEEAAAQYASLFPLPNNRAKDYWNAAVLFSVTGRTNEAASAMRDRLKDFAFENDRLDPVLTAALVLNELPAATNALLLAKPLSASPTAPDLLAHGLGRFRAGDAVRARELLRPIFEHSPNPHLAILAGDYLSLALKQTGDTAQATRALEAANVRFERVLRCGDTGESQWLWAALCLIARDEAERGVFGEIRSAPVNGAYIARMREQWKPVHELLEAALQHCRHQRWPEARTAFLQVIQHPAFSWEAGEVAVGNLRFLMALTFKRAGDDVNYRELCDSPPPDAFLAPLNHLTVSLDFQKSADRVLVYDFSKAFQSSIDMGGPQWKGALTVLAGYAANNQLDAVAAKFDAATNCNHWGRQTVGLALGAATQVKLGKRERAAALLAAAEAKWIELEANNQPDRAFHWPELTLCELALEEARRQVGPTNVVGK